MKNTIIFHMFAGGVSYSGTGPMKRIYSNRRKCLIASLFNIFGSRAKISGDAAGLHLVAEMTGSLCDSQVVAQLEELHIKIYPAEKYTIAKGRYEDRLIMGFGNVEEINILEGIKAIASVLRM